MKALSPSLSFACRVAVAAIVLVAPPAHALALPTAPTGVASLH